MAALEYIDGELVVSQNDALPVAAMANIPYHRAAYAYQNDGPRWWWSNPGRVVRCPLSPSQRFITILFGIFLMRHIFASKPRIVKWGTRGANPFI